MQTAGFVLVGGRSTRMGRDKALLRMRGHSVVEAVANQVAEAAGSVALIGPPARYRSLPFECLPDTRPNCGPLAGIESALQSGRGDLNLIAACDMPGLDATMLSLLIANAENSRAMCTITRDRDAVIHPLCAVYRTACLPAIREALDAGRRKVMDVLRELRPSVFEVNSVLSNVNTPREWREWRTSSGSARRHLSALPRV